MENNKKLIHIFGLIFTIIIGILIMTFYIYNLDISQKPIPEMLLDITPILFGFSMILIGIITLYNLKYGRNKMDNKTKRQNIIGGVISIIIGTIMLLFSIPINHPEACPDNMPSLPCTFLLLYPIFFSIALIIIGITVIYFSISPKKESKDKEEIN